MGDSDSLVAVILFCFCSRIYALSTTMVGLCWIAFQGAGYAREWVSHSCGRSSVVLSKTLEIIVAWSMHHRSGSSAIRTGCDRADDLVGCIWLTSIISMLWPLGRWICTPGSQLAVTVTIEGDTCLDPFLCILFTALSTLTHASVFF